MRMLDRGSPFWKNNYVRYLNQLIDSCCLHHLKPLITIHDQTGADHIVARQLLAHRRQAVEIVLIEDPWELKQKLSGMRFVIGSRFHGLVAAISNGVPVIALGWSHKYAELLSDFDIPELILDEQDIQGNYQKTIAALADEDNNRRVRTRITDAYRTMLAVNNDMWRSVGAALAS